MTQCQHYYITKGIQTVIGKHTDRLAFVNDCVARFGKGDYGIVGEDSESINQQVTRSGLGTESGIYQASFNTGDYGNQICVSRDWDGIDAERFIVVHLPTER